MEMRYGLGVFTKIFGSGAVVTGGSYGAVIGLEYDEKRANLNNYETLVTEWNNKHKNMKVSCEVSEEKNGTSDTEGETSGVGNLKNCDVDSPHLLSFHDEERWEFLYYYAALSVLLGDTEITHPPTAKQIEKVKNDYTYQDVLKKIDPQRRWTWSYSVYVWEEWKKFRKMCFMLVQDYDVKYNSFGTPGNYCIWDADVELDWKHYKKYIMNHYSFSNFTGYLDSQKTMEPQKYEKNKK